MQKVQNNFKQSNNYNNSTIPQFKVSATSSLSSQVTLSATSAYFLQSLNQKRDTGSKDPNQSNQIILSKGSSDQKDQEIKRSRDQKDQEIKKIILTIINYPQHQIPKWVVASQEQIFNHTTPRTQHRNVRERPKTATMINKDFQNVKRRSHDRARHHIRRKNSGCH